MPLPRTLHPADHPPRPVAWYVVLGLLGAYAVLIAVVVSLRETSDFRDFWENARHFRATGEISAELGVHNYLPFFTIFMLPWSFFPLKVASVLFSLLSLVLFAIAAALTENLLHDGLGRRPRPAFLVALALALPYVHACLVLGNVGLLLLFLIVTAWFLAERGDEAAAGAALGLATLIKLLPALLIVYFLLKRRWRIGGTASAVVVVLGAGLPLVTLGWDATVAEHRAFRSRVSAGSAAATLTATQPVKAMYSNNALPMVLRRLLTPTNAGKEATGPLYVNLTTAPAPALLALYAGLLAVLCGVSVVQALTSGPAWPPPTPAAGQRVRAEFGAWCCLLLLVSPLVWTHYLPLVYWALAWLADRGARAAGRAPAAVLIPLAIWALAIAALAWPGARAAGAQLAAVLAVWTGCVALGTQRGQTDA